MSLQGVNNNKPGLDPFYDQLRKDMDTILDRQRALEVHQIAMDLDQQRSNALAEENAREIARLQGRARELNIKGGVGGAKILVKVGTKEIAFQAGRLVSTQVGKTASKIASKAIPIISIMIGIPFAIYRWQKGEYLKAIGEVISAGLTLVPGIGTAVSVCLDFILGGHDVYSAFHHNGNDNELLLVGEVTLKHAYETLKIEIENPTKKQVDQAYRKTVQQVHPDPIGGKGGAYHTDTFGTSTEFVNACKELIYQHHGWS